jgi:hypothetical protein
MKKLLLVPATCLIATPAHAISIVSLHVAGSSFVSVSMGIVVVSALALAATIAFRLAKR